MKYRINNIPEAVYFILQELNKYGYSAYIVGGCVRDSLLGRTPKDWDICTSATPQQVIDTFPYEDIIPTGLQHGTVTIMINNEPYEVTTFRIDGDYSDSRRPDNVEFTGNLVEDLRRRDFTINAMAYDVRGQLIDPFGGQRDLRNKIIKCVGQPEHRFEEDALRIMRAIRFSAQLNFKIDESTEIALVERCSTLRKISPERLNTEFSKILMSPNAHVYLEHFARVIAAFIPEITDMFDFDQCNPYHIYTVYGHTLKALSYALTEDLVIKLAVYFHDIGKPHCFTKGEDRIGHFKGHGHKSAELTEEILKRLRFDNKTIDEVTQLILYHDATLEVSKKNVKRWLNRIGEEQFRRLLLVRLYDIHGQNPKYLDARVEKLIKINVILEDVLAEEECFTLKDLAVNGKDLIKIGYKPGKLIGEVLDCLLEAVIDGEAVNDKESLIMCAQYYPKFYETERM